MMSKERLEEIKKLRETILEENDFRTRCVLASVFVGLGYMDYLINRVQELETTVDFYQSALRDADRRVQELEKRIKELEYASKYNGKLNEFLQKRKLPPNTLGRHVVEVVMDYVEELEQQNKRYRELINQIKNNIPSEFNHRSEYEAKKNVIRLINIDNLVNEYLEGEE